MPPSLPQDEEQYYSQFGAEEAANLRKLGSFRDIPRGTKSESAIRLSSILDNPPPYPSTKWLMSRFDSPAEWDVFEYMGELKGKSVLQLGGSGLMAAMFAFLGAESRLITPVAEECEVG